MGDARSLLRSLHRAIRVAFAGDVEMLAASRKHIREVFEERRRVSDPAELEKHFQEGREAAEFLLKSIVQAKLNPEGNYEVKLRKEHVGQQFEEITPRTTKPRKIHQEM